MVKLENFYAVYKVNGSYTVLSETTMFANPVTGSSGSYIEVWQLDNTGFFKPEQTTGFVQYLHSKQFPSPTTLLLLQREREGQVSSKNTESN
jgi:hypothetical protein